MRRKFGRSSPLEKNSFTSPPAQKMRPRPERITARTLRSPWTVMIASCRRRPSSSEKPLAASGRLSSISAMPSA